MPIVYNHYLKQRTLNINRNINMTISNLNNQVDRLGALMAQKADLDARISAIKSELVESGETVVEGVFFRATVSQSVRKTLNMAKVKAKLSRQFMAANTRETDVTTVRTVARNGA